MKYTLVVVFCLALVSQVLTVPAPPQTPPGTASVSFGSGFTVPQSFGGAPSQNGWPTPQLPQGAGATFSQPGGQFAAGPKTTLPSQTPSSVSQVTRNSPTLAKITSELANFSEQNLATILSILPAVGAIINNPQSSFLFSLIKSLVPQSLVGAVPTQPSNGPVSAGPRSSSQWPEQYPPMNGGQSFGQVPRIPTNA